jgi:pimeloyl-ACP methyl ester carboxylesterase
MPKITADGLTLHYLQDGTGPDLVLIHGLCGSLAVWQLRIAPDLSRDFSVLTYDLRGHGQSDAPPSGYRSSDMAADLLALLDHLGITQAHVVGHSFGGVVALHFAALHPARIASLTISDSRVRSLQPSQKLKEWIHWPIWKAQLKKRGVVLDEDSEMDFLLLDQLVQPPAPQGAEPDATPQPSIAAQNVARFKALLANTTANNDLRDPDGLTDAVIGSIGAPVHAMYGEYSFCLPTLEGLRRLLPDLKVTILPKVGHFFPLTQPDVFLLSLREFFSSLDARSKEAPDATEPPATPDENDHQQDPAP